MEMRRWSEAATQTYKQGVPLRLSSGDLVECDTADPWVAADVVVGISAEPGHNLTTAGTKEPAYSEGSPVNQASAKIIPAGAWSRDGNCGFYPADGKNVFLISLKSGQTYSEALKVAAGSYYTLKQDGTSKYWYLDSTDLVGNNAVAEIVGGVSDDTTKVLFRFKAAQRYFD